MGLITKGPCHSKGFSPQHFPDSRTFRKSPYLTGLDRVFTASAWFPHTALPVFAMKLQTIVKAKEVAGLLHDGFGWHDGSMIDFPNTNLFSWGGSMTGKTPKKRTVTKHWTSGGIFCRFGPKNQAAKACYQLIFRSQKVPIVADSFGSPAATSILDFVHDTKWNLIFRW